MVNLLFISNSTKIDAIRNALQPFLKVKIDIVGDFDYGLKDVFEKRPATVFIQDHIAGVTGESVARHIQMLLGASAPSFIFMYEGSTKANPIKGLFDYLIDLSQTESKIVVDIQATLKSLLGVSQWEKIYIPPKIDNAARPDAVAPDVNRSFADKLVDDFLTDLDNSGPESAEIKFQSTDISELSAPAEESFQIISSPHDQLAEILSENSSNSRKIEPAPTAANKDLTIKPSVPTCESNTTQNQQSDLKRQDAAGLDVPSAIAPPPHAKQSVNDPAVQQPPSGKSSIQQPSPADFIISGERPSDELYQKNFYGCLRKVIIHIPAVGSAMWQYQLS